MAKPLSQEEIQQALAELPGWSWSDDKLKKTFTFGGFREAVGFIVRLAFSAEEMNHHPELHNIYDTVDIALATHDAGDVVTQRDVKLAKAIEDLSWV
jgi:4a-hydroxytetrahydrobiopterin dehydratase